MESNSSFQNLMAHQMKRNHIPIYLTFPHSFLLTDESSQMNGNEGKERSWSSKPKIPRKKNLKVKFF